MFHIGHLNILRQAKESCDQLIVGVSTDNLILENKGHLPIIPFSERLDIIRAIRYVDDVYVQNNSDKTKAFCDLKFQEIYVGDDWKGSKPWNAYEEYFKLFGVNVIYFNYTMHTSSTKLKQLIEQKLI